MGRRHLTSQSTKNKADVTLKHLMHFYTYILSSIWIGLGIPDNGISWKGVLNRTTFEDGNERGFREALGFFVSPRLGFPVKNSHISFASGCINVCWRRR